MLEGNFKVSPRPSLPASKGYNAKESAKLFFHLIFDCSQA